MFYPTLEKAMELAGDNQIIPISMEMFADQRTTMEILRSLRKKSKQFFLLESVANQESWGRYTFLGYDPKMTLQGVDGTITLKDGMKSETITTDDPAGYLCDVLSGYKSPRIEDLPPFTGGLVGYFSYEFVKYTMPGLKLRQETTAGNLDFSLMLIDRVIAVDHFKQKIYLVVNVKTDDLQRNYINAIATLKDMERLVLQEEKSEIIPPVCGPFTASFTEEEFGARVKKAQDYIREGDIFQVVLSNRFTARCEGDLLHTYRVLRTVNPSPYMVFLNIDDVQIVCASPETLVTLHDGKLSSFPLAGTRPRGSCSQDDKRLEEELLLDEKELSEHDMLVDLARNDIGKISKFGTVNVDEYRSIKRFSHVMHIASKVTGQIANDKNALDALTATFPAGTLSGAPKKRACEIIDELETFRRGPYGGAIGYIDFAGSQNVCIAIRMAVKKGNEITVQAGAGIVADSVPAMEYQEIKNKARAVMETLTCEGGKLS